MLKRNLLAVVILSFCASSVFAQPTETVFVTFGQGANVSSTSTVDIADGTTGSAFVYSRGDFFPFLAFDLDFSTTDNSVIQFTGAEVFNPSFNGSTRWTVPSFTGGTANDADGRLLGIANGGEIGIDPELSAIDPFFDSDADAFILARIDYDIVGVGDADISLAVGDNFFFFADPLLDVFFIPTGSGTLTVVGVPEPSSATLLALGLVGFVARRRRA